MPTAPPPLLTIRPATPADAAACIEHATRVIEEFPDNLTFAPGEFDYTLEQEEKILAEAATADNAVFLVALVDDRVVGLLNYCGGERRAQRHAVVLGISVRRAFCGPSTSTRSSASSTRAAGEMPPSRTAATSTTSSWPCSSTDGRFP